MSTTTGKEYKLAIRIAGIIDKTFTTSLASVDSSLSKTLAKVNTNFTTLDKGYKKISSAYLGICSAVATAAGVAATALVAVGAASISAGSEFETAFAGVKKTVDATEDEYEELRQGILELSTTMPASATELADVMETAGQLGIANESLLDFTATMTKLGVAAEDLTADEAATALARFANITNMEDYDEEGVSNFERLGSTITALGNNFATTEAEIVEMATNLAATGEIVGLTEPQIMALATTMSATGVAAEKGGSAMSKLFRKLELATINGGDALENYANVAGMTADSFKELYSEDAVAALSAFINGLSEANMGEESAIKILSDMGLSEVRLTDVILRMANANGVMSDALDVANEAWEENTALQIEYDKFCETSSNQVTLMKDSFTALSIALYDGLLREPYVDVIQAITSAVNNFTNTKLDSWIQKLNTSLPTMERTFKKVWKTIQPIFSALSSVLHWLVDNSEIVLGVFVGIGAALATYKVESSGVKFINDLVKMFNGGGMSGVTVGLMGIVAAVGALVTAVTALKLLNAAAVSENLAQHFGTLTLTMEELQTVAESIVSNDSLSGVANALSAFDDIETYAKEMSDAIDELDKMNWKVSIGIELTEDEQETYINTIDDYVESAQEYALQSEYAVALNLATVFSSDSTVSEQVNQFYADQYDTMTELGKTLNDFVTDAFNDGLLSIDEISVITQLQTQMADIQESLATGEFQAQLSLLELEYGGGALTSETFQNLQAELEEQVASATESYQESYLKNYSAIQAAYNAGYLTDEEYESGLNEVLADYETKVAEVTASASSFMTNTILTQYSDELDGALNGLDELLQEYSLYSEEEWLDDGVILLIDMVRDVTNLMDSIDQQAIQELLEPITDMATQAIEAKDTLEALGAEVPEDLAEAVSGYTLLAALAGNDYGAAASVLGEAFVGDEFYEGLMEQFSELGYYIPESLLAGMSEATTEAMISAQEEIDPTILELYSWTSDTLDAYFSEGFNTSANVSIGLTPKLSAESSAWLNSIGGHAAGGIVENPEISWLAERGPEAVVPLDGSSKAIDLWEKTGQLLGMDSILDDFDAGGSSGPVIEYSPVLQFYGEAPSENDIEDALRISEDEFESLMDGYLKKRGRVSFG